MIKKIFTIGIATVGAMAAVFVLAVILRDDEPTISTRQDVIKKAPINSSWWSPNSTFSSCIESMGPAEKLDSLAGLADRPSARDFRDYKNGELIKVEVSNDSRESIVWTYYKSKEKCQNEKVTKYIADKYR